MTYKNLLELVQADFPTAMDMMVRKLADIAIENFAVETQSLEGKMYLFTPHWMDHNGDFLTDENGTPLLFTQSGTEFVLSEYTDKILELETLGDSDYPVDIRIGWDWNDGRFRLFEASGTPRDLFNVAEDTDYRFIVYYSRKTRKILALTDELDIDERYSMAVVNKVLEHFFARAGNRGMVQYCQSEYAILRREAIRNANQTRRQYSEHSFGEIEL